MLQFCKHKLCSSNLESQNQKRQNFVKENLFMKTKYKVNKKIHNMNNCLFFPKKLDKNTLGGESSKSGCDAFEFHYSSTYNAIHHAPTNVLKQKLILLKNFLTLSFARSTVVKNKYEGVDVGPHE